MSLTNDHYPVTHFRPVLQSTSQASAARADSLQRAGDSSLLWTLRRANLCQGDFSHSGQPGLSTEPVRGSLRVQSHNLSLYF